MKGSHGLDAYWSETFPEVEPIAHVLRNVYRHRWVRFHSLPESKRYADEESEYQILLQRHNSVVESLASPGEALFFVSVGYSESRDPIRHYSELEKLDSTAQCWRTVAMHELEHEQDPNYLHLFASAWSWKSGVFDSILRLVADDIIRGTIIISTINNWIYRPYDGGADVILSTNERSIELARNFAPWLSTRQDGL